MASGTITKHGIQYDTLFPETTKNDRNTITLSASADDYDFILFVVCNQNAGTGGYRQVKIIPATEYGKSIAVTWSATDSTNWYMLICATVSGNQITFQEWVRKGYSGSAIKIVGAKIV